MSGNGQDPEWPEISHRLQSRFDSFLESAPPPRKRKSGTAAFFRGPVPAYALALTLAYPAWLGFNRPRPAAPVLQNTRILHLDSTRSAPPSNPAPPSFFGPLTLDFFVPIRSGVRYSATILDASAQPVAPPAPIESYDGLGRFALACPSLANRPGPFTIRIIPIDTAEPGWTLTFQP